MCRYNAELTGFKIRAEMDMKTISDLKVSLLAAGAKVGELR